MRRWMVAVPFWALLAAAIAWRTRPRSPRVQPNDPQGSEQVQGRWKDLWFVWLPIITSIVVISSGTIGNIIVNRDNNVSEERRTMFESTFDAKYNTYRDFMMAVSDSFNFATSNRAMVMQDNDMIKSTSQFRVLYFSLEPLLDRNTSNAAIQVVADYEAFILETYLDKAKNQIDMTQVYTDYLNYVNRLRVLLYPALFGS